jgi:molecular chaperone GrpE (heat shock protein)
MIYCNNGEIIISGSMEDIATDIVAVSEELAKALKNKGESNENVLAILNTITEAMENEVKAPLSDSSIKVIDHIDPII